MGSWSDGVPASRDLGFNALGFGWPTLWQGPQAAAALAQRVGLKLQIEPFRFWRIADIKRLPADQVIAFEGRWTDHTLLQTAQRVWRAKPPDICCSTWFFKVPSTAGGLSRQWPDNFLRPCRSMRCIWHTAWWKFVHRICRSPRHIWNSRAASSSIPIMCANSGCRRVACLILLRSSSPQRKFGSSSFKPGMKESCGIFCMGRDFSIG
jgi:hypothetical protein